MRHLAKDISTYAGTYELKSFLQENREQFELFFAYVHRSFASRDTSREQFILKYKNTVASGADDMKVLEDLRSELISGISEEELTSRELAYFPTLIKGKIGELMNVLGSSSIKWPPGNVLDIGTELKMYLDSIDNIIKNRGSGGAYGLNIEDGFNHYYPDEFKSLIAAGRIKLYNGYSDIPYADEFFSLCTIVSVIHHINSDNLPRFAASVARIIKLGGYVYIKDVDLTNTARRVSFKWQHILYEGGLNPGDLSYMNCDVTYQNTMKLFAAAGFKHIYTMKKNNFNGTYFSLLQRIR